MTTFVKNHIAISEKDLKKAYKATNHAAQFFFPTAFGQAKIIVQIPPQKKYIEGIDYFLRPGNGEHPGKAGARVLKKIKEGNIPEGKGRDISLRKNEYLYGTPKKAGIIK